MRPTLAIFLKEPRPGRVKTRLAREIGAIDAAWWFRHQSARLIARVARDRRWRTVLAVTPDAEALQSRVWPADLARAPQGPGDLGRRMTRFLRAESGTGVPPGPVAVIGADLPGVAAAPPGAGLSAAGAPRCGAGACDRWGILADRARQPPGGAAGPAGRRALVDRARADRHAGAARPSRHRARRTAPGRRHRRGPPPRPSERRFLRPRLASAGRPRARPGPALWECARRPCKITAGPGMS